MTQRSYSAILGGGGLRWPLLLRIFFVLRKAFGWHFPAASARAKPTELVALTLEQLPKCIQPRFQVHLREAHDLGFRDLVCLRSQTIGHYVSYAYLLVSDDLATVCSITTFRLAVGKTVKEGWAASLRTDLLDGNILATTRGEGRGFPTELLPGKFRWELLPTSSSMAELVGRHQERLADIEPDRIEFVPETGLMAYLLNGVQRDFEQLIDTGMFRRISADEIDRLSRMDFDFPNE